jgi:hypothetical protein
MASKTKKNPKPQGIESAPELTWLKAAYKFHTYAYRDPRSVFASAVGLPVVSPTTVLLGVVSTLFRLSLADDASSFLQIAHKCKVMVDPPEGVVFYRAFHQVRRYESDKWDKPKEGKVNLRIGLTNINQATREYGLLEGPMTIFIGVPKDQTESVKTALANLTHLGTHDSLCSLVGSVKICGKPKNLIYLPREELAQQIHDHGIQVIGRNVTIVTLSRFKSQAPIHSIFEHWYMAGGDDTERIDYVIPGRFMGTSRGKVYRKR